MVADPLHLLTAEERNVLALRLGNQLTADQIATQLGKSPQEVQAIVQAALSRLHRADP